MFKLGKKRVKVALSTPVNSTNSLQLKLRLIGLAFLLLFIGFKTGFLKFNILEKPWGEIVKIVAFSLIMPALAEEIFFRILFLPHPTENPSIKKQIIWGVITLIAFIIYHPLQGITWNPAGREVFMEPIFLILAALLGVMCTIAYYWVGSLWLPVFIHWLAVVIWLVLLDGFSKFNYSPKLLFIYLG